MQENRSGTPLLLVGQNGNRVLNFKLDYIKCLDDYYVFDSVPEMTKEDVKKMVFFFANNDITISNRPIEFHIESINVNALDLLGNTDFSVHFNKDLNQKWIDDFYGDFSNYFDNWMKKFIVLFGEYTKASKNGTVDNLLKKD